MNRETVIGYLSKITDSELASIVHESVKDRKCKQIYKENEFDVSNAMALAICSYGSFDGKLDETATIEIYAPEYEESRSDGSVPVTEQGQCPQCKTNLISDHKEVRCPICCTKTDLT